jgi:hypothetical protein
VSDRLLMNEIYMCVCVCVYTVNIYVYIFIISSRTVLISGLVLICSAALGDLSENLRFVFDVLYLFLISVFLKQILMFSVPYNYIMTVFQCTCTLRNFTQFLLHYFCIIALFLFVSSSVSFTAPYIIIVGLHMITKLLAE